MKEKSKYYVKEIVRPNYTTGEAEREKFKQPKETSKSTNKKQDKKSKGSKVLKQLQKQITSKKFLKRPKLTVKIPEYKPHSILGETNKFFKNEWEESKKTMFFS